MKKFLAVLLVVAMVMALVPTMAFADSPAGVVKVAIETAAEGGDRFQFSTGIAVAAGEEVKIVLNAEGLSDGALSSSTQYIRGVSGLSKQAATVTDLGDGWVELSITAASATSELAFTLYGGSYGAGEYILIDYIQVGETVYAFTSQDDVDAAGFKEYSQPEDLSFEFVAPEVVIPTAPVKVTIETAAEGGDRFQFSTGIEVAAGQEVKIVLNAEGLSDGALSSSTQYIRGVSGLSKQAATVTDLGDGWVELSITAASATSELAFTLYGGSYGAGEYILIDYIQVGETVYAFTSQDDVDAAGFKEYSQPEDLSFELYAEPDDKVDAYTGELNSNDVRSGVKLTDTLAVNDILSFFVKVVPAEGQELADIMAGMKLYVRGNGNSSNKAYYRVDGVVTDNQAYGSKLKDNAVDCGDGWYYVEVSIPAEDSYFLNLNAEDVSGAKLGEGCLYVDICVNGTPVTTVRGYSSDEELTAEKVEKPQLPVVEEPVVVVPDVTVENATVIVKDAEGNVVDSIEAGTVITVEVTAAEGYELVSVTVNGETYAAGTQITVEDALVVVVETAEITPEEPTEDPEDTADVEPTGAISIAVVAMVAVIGGAVVLKKKEF